MPVRLPAFWPPLWGASAIESPGPMPRVRGFHVVHCAGVSFRPIHTGMRRMARPLGELLADAARLRPQAVTALAPGRPPLTHGEIAAQTGAALAERLRASLDEAPREGTP